MTESEIEKRIVFNVGNYEVGASVRARGSIATVVGREWCESCQCEHIMIMFQGSQVPFLANVEDLELVE